MVFFKINEGTEGKGRNPSLSQVLIFYAKLGSNRGIESRRNLDLGLQSIL